MASKKMHQKIALAFSGGLDTTFCLVWLREKYGAEVIPVTVDTGGFDAGERRAIEKRARDLRAKKLVWRDAKTPLYEEFIAYLIYGNCLKGGIYPYCVAAERTLQAREVAEVARATGATAVAHGSTGAGNDQVRLDGVFQALAPELEILTPIRDLKISRDEEIAYLKKKGFEAPKKQHAFSVNRGMWGTTYGNRALQDARNSAPFEGIYSARQASVRREDFEIRFEDGIPVALNGRKMKGPALVENLNNLGGRFRVGMGLHTGTTALGIKGRIAFDAPAATILIRAHSELEKAVLTRDELFWKLVLGEVYGDFLHRGLYLHPLMREIEAFLGASQGRVRGRVTGFLAPGEAVVTGVDSPHSLFGAQNATYGEGASWSPDAVKGFIQFHHLETVMAYGKARGGERRNG